MPGLYVHRASRLEALAETLARHLAAQPPAAVLAPQQVVVAHPGMKRWLQQQLAQRGGPGAGGIAANLAFLLPGEWWLRLGDAMLGAADAAPWQYAVLRWRLYALLAGRIEDARLRRYVEHAPPRRRWLLAAHLARLFGEYQVYRPDWLQRWDAGDAVTDGAHWQAALWRALRAGTPAPPRALREQALLQALAEDGAGDGEPVHVFGIAHLPPGLLRGLKLLARQRDVHVYFPDPCRELWDDLRSARAQLRAPEADGDTHYEVGHPLLAGLGRIGQEFARSLNSEDEAQEDRDARDEDDAPTARLPLLARLQESIRRLQPQAAAGTAARADASLRVHACHGRLRELEVLRDALLMLRAADPALEPRQIVVMAPRVEEYAPLLPAVFGTPGQWHDAALPWHLADVPLAATHPLFAAWRQLLGLAQSRCTLEQVLDLLEVPALARRFGLEGAARGPLAEALREAQVVWALDGAMKADFGAPPEDLNTLAFGLDRLLAGWLLGPDLQHAALSPPRPQMPAVAPLPRMQGGDLALLAGLAHLLQELREWRAAARTPRSAAEWSRWLGERCDAAFAADPADRAEADALLQLRRIAAMPGAEAATAGVTGAMDWAVIAAQQNAALDEVPARAPYLAEGLRVCGMVPQRTVPYRVVAVLGLNEGEFPRVAPPSSLDLIARHPRAGDRSALEEDRYLFLEALMAAREALHLSYVAEDAQGQPRNPAAPLAELQAFLDAVHGPGAGEARPWCVRHPLQPFAPAYFEQAEAGFRPDPALRSCAQVYADAAGTGDQPGGAPPLLPRAGLASAVPAVDLPGLRAFLQRPARVVAQVLLGVRLPGEDEAPRESEPLTADVEARLRLPAQLLQQALAARAPALPVQPPAWLARSGVLAAGPAGAEAWQDLRGRVQAALALLRDHPLASAQPVAVACALDPGGGATLAGSVPALRDGEGRHWLLEVHTRRTLDFSVRLPLWLDGAALALSLPPAQRGGSLLLHLREQPQQVPVNDAMRQPAAELRAGIHRLLHLYQEACAARAWYLPATAWAVATAGPDRHVDAARTAWAGDSSGPGERGYSPEAALLLRGRDWIAEAETWQAFAAMAQWLHALVAPRETP